MFMISVASEHDMPMNSLHCSQNTSQSKQSHSFMGLSQFEHEKFLISLRVAFKMCSQKVWWKSGCLHR